MAWMIACVGRGARPRRGDDPRSEGGGVEPVIDSQDQVLLQGPGQGRVGPPPGHHPQVIGPVTQLGVRVAWIEAWPGGTGRLPGGRGLLPAGSGHVSCAESRSYNGCRSRLPQARGDGGGGLPRSPSCDTRDGREGAEVFGELPATSAARARLVASPGRSRQAGATHSSRLFGERARRPSTGGGRQVLLLRARRRSR